MILIYGSAPPPPLQKKAFLRPEYCTLADLAILDQSCRHYVKSGKLNMDVVPETVKIIFFTNIINFKNGNVFGNCYCKYLATLAFLILSNGIVAYI